MSSGPLPTIVTTQDDSISNQPTPDEPRTSVSQQPPSPTLSTSSAQFNTSTNLRSNNPTAASGTDSLNLLGPNTSSSHGRKPSIATSAETEPDSPLSPTATGTTKVSGKGGPDEAIEKVAHIDPSHDDTDTGPFTHKPLVLAALVDPKSFNDLEAMGGADGLISSLGTHRTKGLSQHSLRSAADAAQSGKEAEKSEPAGEGATFQASLDERRRVYGANVLPSRASKSLLQLMWIALKDKVLILLCIAAVISLALGLYSDFGVKHQPIICPDTGLPNCTEPKVEWVEGVAIMVAVAIVVCVGSLNDWQKERQFRALNDKKEDRTVKVIRDGKETVINIREIVVGDVALLEPGEIVPCDGVFLKGHNVRCDESGATGESDAIKKFTYEDALEEKQNAAPGERLKRDCFLISGSKVLEGVGEYVVIAVGQKSFNGRIMMALRGDTENTPLQIKLNALAELIAKLGSLAGLILFSALMIRFFVNLKEKPNRTSNEKAMNFVEILIIAVTVIVVAVPEGLPLAVTLALAFATKRMTGQNLLVRVLSSCETMANASVVCTDKTGTLTQNVMTVVAGSVGVHCKFVKDLDQNATRSNVGDVEGEGGDNRRHTSDFAVEMAELNKALNEPLRRLFNQAIAINSTAFEDKDPVSGQLEFVGSKTETALLSFAKALEWEDYKKTREAAQVIQMIPFSSERKSMGVVVKSPEGKYRLFLKGASEILCAKSTRHILVKDPKSADSAFLQSDEIPTKEINEIERENISRTIIFYANQTLRTIGICYRDFEQWPPAGHVREPGVSSDEVSFDLLFEDLTLIAITAIEDPLRPGVREAVQDCHRAGVTVKMCTGDNVLTARSIATQCGIYTAGGIIMEGPVFRKLSDAEMTEVVPRLQVLARSSPEDKKILVEKLKSLGEIVGVTGDGTNDGPALKTANVGFSMGIAGTEVAKEASDIILMDDNFSSIVSAIMWGRCVNDSVRKFLQFQISVNITAVLITFVSAVASDEEESVLTAVQLLWINIIMDTFAALALATDPASRDVLDRKPDRKTAPLFNVDMRKQIIGQSMYQTFIILLFHFASDKIFSYDKTGKTDQQINAWHAETNTLIFNAFVFAQIFNSINSRRIDNTKNVFSGIHKNPWFIGITLLEIGIQILIVFVGGAAFSVHDMSGRSWGVSIALGFVSLPLGFLIRCIPNGPVEKLFIKLRIMHDPNVLPVLSPERQQWNEAIDTVRDNLQTFANIRGGRVRASSFVKKSRSQRLQEAGIQLPQLLTMVPTLVMSSIGAGWQPQPGSMADPAGSDPSKSSAALFAGQIQIHPDTPKDDPVYAKYGHSQQSPV